MQNSDARASIFGPGFPSTSPPLPQCTLQIYSPAQCMLFSFLNCRARRAPSTRGAGVGSRTPCWQRRDVGTSFRLAG